MVGSIKGNKILQFQRVSSVSELCFLNAALIAVQKAAENKASFCGCRVFGLFFLFNLKYSFTPANGQIHPSLMVGFLQYIAELDKQKKIFCLDPGQKNFQLRSSLLPSGSLTSPFPLHQDVIISQL